MRVSKPAPAKAKEEVEEEQLDASPTAASPVNMFGNLTMHEPPASADAPPVNMFGNMTLHSPPQENLKQQQPAKGEGFVGRPR